MVWNDPILGPPCGPRLEPGAGRHQAGWSAYEGRFARGLNRSQVKPTEPTTSNEHQPGWTARRAPFRWCGQVPVSPGNPGDAWWDTLPGGRFILTQTITSPPADSIAVVVNLTARLAPNQA